MNGVGVSSDIKEQLDIVLREALAQCEDISHTVQAAPTLRGHVLRESIQSMAARKSMVEGSNTWALHLTRYAALPVLHATRPDHVLPPKRTASVWAVHLWTVLLGSGRGVPVSVSDSVLLGPFYI